MKITGVSKMKANMIELVRTEAGQEAHVEEGSLLGSTTLTEGPMTPW